LRLGRLSRPFVHTGDKIDRVEVDFVTSVYEALKVKG